MAKKKTNPRKIPASKADVMKAFNAGLDAGLEGAFTIFLTVLRDKFDFDSDQIARVFQELTNLCDSVDQGYLSIEDMDNTLLEEAGITKDSEEEGGRR